MAITVLYSVISFCNTKKLWTKCVSKSLFKVTKEHTKATPVNGFFTFPVNFEQIFASMG